MWVLVDAKEFNLAEVILTENLLTSHHQMNESNKLELGLMFNKQLCKSRSSIKAASGKWSEYKTKLLRFSKAS